MQDDCIAVALELPQLRILKQKKKVGEGLADWERKRLTRLFYYYPELKKAWLLIQAVRSQFHTY